MDSLKLCNFSIICHVKLWMLNAQLPFDMQRTATLGIGTTLSLFPSQKRRHFLQKARWTRSTTQPAVLVPQPDSPCHSFTCLLLRSFIPKCSQDAARASHCTTEGIFPTVYFLLTVTFTWSK